MLNALQNVQNCYNFLSNVLYANGYINKALNRYSIHKQFYHTLRCQFPSLSSQMVIKVILEVVSNWKSWLKTSKKKSNFPQKRNLSLIMDKRLYSKLTTHSVNIAVPNHRKVTCTFTTYPLLQKMFDTYDTQNCNILYQNGQFYLIIQFNVPSLPLINDQVLGIDRGERRIITCSDGTAIRDKVYNCKRRRLRYLKRILTKSNTHSAKQHLQRIKNKERYISCDYSNKIANAILSKSQGTIVLEKLNGIKNNTAHLNKKNNNKCIKIKKKRHNNRFGQIPLWRIQTILEHKAPLYGKQVVTVEPAFTSQNDCRGITKGIRSGTRYYAADGLVFDADWNAAINIANRYHPIPFKLPICGQLNFMGRPMPNGQMSYNA